MTSIIGLVEKDKMYIAGDSQATGGYITQQRKDKKVFAIDNKFLIGFTTSYRMGQILMYYLKPPKDTIIDTHRYMVTKFVPEVIKVFKSNNYLLKDEKTGGDFIVLYRKKLFVIESDFQVAEPKSDFASVGSGSEFCMGAMEGFRFLPPYERLRHSIEVSAKYCNTVGGDVDILSL